MFSDEELLTLHWLANNGFQKLLVLAKKGTGEIQTREQAELPTPPSKNRKRFSQEIVLETRPRIECGK